MFRLGRSTPPFGGMIRNIYLVLALGLFSASMALAQVGGQVSGRVTDPSDAVIPNAKIAATNLNTGVATSTQSNGSGYYVMPLQAGDYKIATTAPGFATLINEKLTVTIGGDEAVDFHLPVATTNFGTPNTDIQTPAFGEITTLQTGSPRSLQLAGTISW